MYSFDRNLKVVKECVQKKHFHPKKKSHEHVKAKIIKMVVNSLVKISKLLFIFRNSSFLALSPTKFN